MDQFAHITLELEALRSKVNYKFDPERCRDVGYQYVPDSNDFDLLKLRRTYHFNKGTEDHIMLTIPTPVYVLAEKGSSFIRDCCTEPLDSRSSREEQEDVEENRLTDQTRFKEGEVIAEDIPPCRSGVREAVTSENIHSIFKKLSIIDTRNVFIQSKKHISNTTKGNDLILGSKDVRIHKEKSEVITTNDAPENFPPEELGQVNHELITSHKNNKYNNVISDQQIIHSLHDNQDDSINLKHEQISNVSLNLEAHKKAHKKTDLLDLEMRKIHGELNLGEEYANFLRSTRQNSNKILQAALERMKLPNGQQISLQETVYMSQTSNNTQKPQDAYSLEELMAELQENSPKKVDGEKCNIVEGLKQIPSPVELSVHNGSLTNCNLDKSIELNHNPQLLFTKGSCVEAKLIAKPHTPVVIHKNLISKDSVKIIQNHQLNVVQKLDKSHELVEPVLGRKTVKFIRMSKTRLKTLAGRLQTDGTGGYKFIPNSPKPFSPNCNAEKPPEAPQSTQHSRTNIEDLNPENPLETFEHLEDQNAILPRANLVTEQPLETMTDEHSYAAHYCYNPSQIKFQERHQPTPESVAERFLDDYDSLESTSSLDVDQTKQGDNPEENFCQGEKEKPNSLKSSEYIQQNYVVQYDTSLKSVSLQKNVEDTRDVCDIDAENEEYANYMKIISGEAPSSHTNSNVQEPAAMELNQNRIEAEEPAEKSTIYTPFVVEPVEPPRKKIFNIQQIIVVPARPNRAPKKTLKLRMTKPPQTDHYVQPIPEDAKQTELKPTDLTQIADRLKEIYSVHKNYVVLEGSKDYTVRQTGKANVREVVGTSAPAYTIEMAHHPDEFFHETHHDEDHTGSDAKKPSEPINYLDCYKHLPEGVEVIEEEPSPKKCVKQNNQTRHPDAVPEEVSIKLQGGPSARPSTSRSYFNKTHGKSTAPSQPTRTIFDQDIETEVVPVEDSTVETETHEENNCTSSDDEEPLAKRLRRGNTPTKYPDCIKPPTSPKPTQNPLNISQKSTEPKSPRPSNWSSLQSVAGPSKTPETPQNVFHNTTDTYPTMFDEVEDEVDRIMQNSRVGARETPGENAELAELRRWRFLKTPTRYVEYEPELDMINLYHATQNRINSDSPVSVVSRDSNASVMHITEHLSPYYQKTFVGGRTVYNCNKCIFKSDRESHMKVHVRCHIHPFWCSLCYAMFAKTTELEDHFQEEHLEFYENYRPGNYTSASELREKPFKCGYCNYSSSYTKRLENHLLTHDKQRIINCSKCSFATTTEWVHVRHMKMHEEDCLLECENCGFSDLSRAVMDQHMQLHNRKMILTCDLCTFTTGSFGYLNIHKLFHTTKVESESEEENTDNSTYSCGECCFTSTTTEEVFEHGKIKHKNMVTMRLHHMLTKKKSYLCLKCGFTLHTMSNLRMHVAGHRSETGIKMCEVCDFETQTEAELEAHGSVHYQERQYQCVKCTRLYRTAAGLKNHRRTVHNC